MIKTLFSLILLCTFYRAVESFPKETFSLLGDGCCTDPENLNRTKLEFKTFNKKSVTGYTKAECAQFCVKEPNCEGLNYIGDVPGVYPRCVFWVRGDFQVYGDLKSDEHRSWGEILRCGDFGWQCFLRDSKKGAHAIGAAEIRSAHQCEFTATRDVTGEETVATLMKCKGEKIDIVYSKKFDYHISKVRIEKKGKVSEYDFQYLKTDQEQTICGIDTLFYRYYKGIHVRVERFPHIKFDGLFNENICKKGVVDVSDTHW